MRTISSRKYLTICFIFLLTTSISSVMSDQTPSPKAPYKVVFQVTDGDAQKWNLTLVNAMNVITELGKHNVAIEIVVYGPAIDMLKLESEVAPRVDEVIKHGVNVVACENTMHGERLTPADMLPDLDFTRTGVVYLMEKQKKGYAYIRP